MSARSVWECEAQALELPKLMSDAPENRATEEADATDQGDERIHASPPPPGRADENEALSGGPRRSLGLSLLTLALLLVFLGVKSLLRAEEQQDSVTAVACAALMALSLLVAIPCWMVSTVYAVGSLVTGQRRFGFSLLALLQNATSAIVFLVVK